MIRPSGSGPRSSTPSEGGVEGVAAVGAGEEPSAYLVLAAQVLAWLSAQLKPNGVEQGWMAEYAAASANPAFIDVVATLVKEVDEDLAPPRCAAWAEFSASLYAFTHSLVTLVGGSAPLSAALLAGLGLDPALPGSAPWPLAAPPRHLSILAQVLLLRQRQEADTYSVKVGTIGTYS